MFRITSPDVFAPFAFQIRHANARRIKHLVVVTDSILPERIERGGFYRQFHAGDVVRQLPSLETLGLSRVGKGVWRLRRKPVRADVCDPNDEDERHKRAIRPMVKIPGCLLDAKVYCGTTSNRSLICRAGFKPDQGSDVSCVSMQRRDVLLPTGSTWSKLTSIGPEEEHAASDGQSARRVYETRLAKKKGSKRR